ncbi:MULTISPECIES: alpha/beta hydrolase [unclassified Caulobacter]|uniref:alpha/beta hydrolase n=1 Tax=unclassified Caulobacter TaxID=2648921 RepID=UPI0006F57782|nr:MULTISPECIES: alpha/beta hydrolase [unclassified Caulobacter]KQV62580.1 alpha/beta hydrolase [Caulobacter sp. Root342]KQV65411.1 alpha/beta hydrolase [Caulobacter sp. Root343]
MSRLSWIAAAVGALSLSALGGATHAAAPRFKPAACVGDYKGVDLKVECGNLIVDESRGDPKSRRIKVAVAIVRAAAPKAGLPPVVYLHGGPGGSALGGLPRMLKSKASREFVAVDQDWIFLDQRGGGQSDPNLDCPGANLTDAGPPSEQDKAGIVACLKAFQAKGVNLSRYNAVEVARDVQDLRAVLKLPLIDLFGGSYGTRIEAAIQTHAPQGVRAVVQDSPWPPEADWTVGGPAMVSSSIDIVMAKCAVVAECARRYPDLKAKLAVVAERWLAGPQTLNGKTYTADDLGGYLMDASYFTAGVLPRDLWKIIQGDVAPVEAFVESRDYYSEGQFMTHLCKEEIPFEKRADVAKGTEADPVARLMVASMQRIHDVCAGVDVGPISKVEQQPVRTAVPTLFLAAEIDPGCPPELTRAAAKGYQGSQVVIVTNATHGVSRNSPCARKMIRSFFQDPTKPVDRSCLPAADTPMSFTYE